MVGVRAFCRVEGLRPSGDLECGRIQGWHRGERLLRGTCQQARSIMLDRASEKEVRVLQPDAGALKVLDCSRKTVGLDTDRRHHGAAAAEVGVRDQQAIELRLVAQAGARGAEPVVAGHGDDVPAQLLDDPSRIRDPFPVRWRLRLCPTPGKHGNDQDRG